MPEASVILRNSACISRCIIRDAEGRKVRWTFRRFESSAKRSPQGGRFFNLFEQSRGGGCLKEQLEHFNYTGDGRDILARYLNGEENECPDGRQKAAILYW